MATFENFTLDRKRRELRRDGVTVAVEPQVFDLLVCLVAHRDRVVDRDMMLAEVWDGRIVSESTLTTRINAARRALGDSGREQRLIRTVRGRGFRFVGEVAGDGADPPGESAARHGRIGVLPFDSDDATSELAAPLREAVTESFSRNPSGLRTTDLGRLVTPGSPLAEQAEFVVAGRLYRQGKTVHVSAQLIETESNNILAAVRHDVPAGEPSVIVSLLDEAVFNRLIQVMYLRGPRSTGPLAMTGFDYLVLARARNTNMKPEDNWAAETIALDGLERFNGFAPLHALLSYIRLLRASSLWRPEVDDDIQAAVEAARRSIAIDASNSWALQMLAIALAYQGEKEEGLLASERAAAAYPTFSGPITNRSILLSYLGRIEEAFRDRATKLNPNAWRNDDLDWGRLLYIAGRYDEALPYLQRYSVMAPLTNLIELILAATHHALGETDRAAELVARHRKAMPWSSVELVRKVTTYPEPKRQLFYDVLRRYGLPQR